MDLPAPKPPNPSQASKQSLRRTSLALDRYSQTTRHRKFTRVEQHILSTDTPGYLEVESPLEKTFKLRQSALLPHTNQATIQKAAFQLDLAHTRLAPYIRASYSRSGRSLLVASQKGHVAVTTWRDAALSAEIFLNETVRDVAFLHDDSFFVAAQKSYAYIYDGSGAEVHVLRRHVEPGFVQFLPHHLLVVTASATGASKKHLVYSDTTTGAVISSHDFSERTLRLAAATASCTDASNGVVQLGHSNGVVSLWSPASARPLARILVAAGGVRAADVASDGRSMVTCGADRSVKVWDLRTYRVRQAWRTETQGADVAISQRGVVAVALRSCVKSYVAGKHGLYGDVYVEEEYRGRRVRSVEFCPFEDVAAVCVEDGVASMVVPGAGEAMFDSAAPNPYETRRQRSDREVKGLLDKLPPESIVLDTSVLGDVDAEPGQRVAEIRERVANGRREGERADRKRAKGRNRISKRVARKKMRIVDGRGKERERGREELMKTVEAARKMREERDKQEDGDGNEQSRMPSALDRFFTN